MTREERKKRAGLLLLVAALLSGMVLLSGCRDSPVLEQIIYTTQEAPPDEDAEQNDNEKDHTDKDDDLAAKQEDDESDSERDRQEESPTRGGEDDPDTAPDVQHDQNSVNTGDAGGSGTGEDTQPDETESTGITETPTVDPAGGTALRQVVDAFGRTVSVPENVDTVTAVGSSAAMVEMLGGSGRLTAASASFTQNEISGQVFSGTSSGTVATLWRGDGSYGMDETSFQQLLSQEPDVCFALSGVFSFSDAQLAKLEDAGIYCVTLPQLNTPDNIKSAVTLIGQVLGDQSASGGTDAPALAEEYCRWYDGITAKVSARVDRFNYNDVDYSQDRYAQRTDTYLKTETDSGFYALYLSDWDAGASYKVYSDSYVTLSGSGVAIAPSGYSTTPFSYYMSLAGVVNTGAAAADQFKLRHWYVNPLQSSTRIIEIAGSGGTVTDQLLTAVTDPATGLTVSLGEERFPAVIAENSAVKAALEADAADNKLWTDYGQVTSSDGKVSGYGFSDEIGQFVSTSIRGTYEIYVVPHGVDSWSSGSAESVLSAMWIAGVYYDAFSEDELIVELQNFYRQFYHYDLSRSMAQDILAGR